MLQFRFLQDEDVAVLHPAFIEAFSDYQVKMDLPLWKFQQMLLRRGFCADSSIGAFDGDRLAGFVLNGLRQWNGRLTAYDLGTGVIPDYRRQGITTALLGQIKEMLPGKQVRQYLLEVLKANEPALQLYQKQGFQIQREFRCLTMERAAFVPATAFPVERVEHLNMESLESFWDFEPSWQNSNDSIAAVADGLRYAVARRDGKCIGYGVIDPKTGDIPQIAVHPAHRGRGVGKSLLSELVQLAECPRLTVLNIQAGDGLEQFLLRLGFAPYVDQYEMTLTL